MSLTLRTLLVIVLLITNGCVDVQSLPVEGRIIGGVLANVSANSYAVIINTDRSGCGATVITPNWLMSAAHCFLDKKNGYVTNNTDPTLWTATAGVSDRFQPASYEKRITAKFRKIKLHPKYTPTNKDGYLYDIALINLESILPESSIVIARLPASTTSTMWPPYDSNFSLIGWGCRHPGQKPSDQAYLGLFKLLSSNDCQAIKPGHNNELELCAGSQPRRDFICAGDSGSGLIYEENRVPYIVGVASTTLHHKLSIFARVSNLLPWINMVLNNPT